MSTTTGAIPAIRTAPTRPATPSRRIAARRVAVRPVPAPVARPGSAPTSAAPVRPGADRISGTVGGEAGIRRDPLRIAARLSPLLGLGLSIALVVWGLDAGVLRSLTNLQAFIDSLGAWGPLAFFVVSAASVVFPIVPGGLLVIAGPVLFGAVEGTVLNYLAVCSGSLLNFLIARHVGLGLIQRMFRPRTVEKLLGWTRSAHFTRAFALAIALPVAPDDLLCYIAGTTRMRWRTYVAIILLCKPWALIAYGLGVSALLLRFLPW